MIVLLKRLGGLPTIQFTTVKKYSLVKEGIKLVISIDEYLGMHFDATINIAFPRIGNEDVTCIVSDFEEYDIK